MTREMYERQETPEEFLIRSIQEKGVEDPEIQTLLRTWEDQQTEELEGIPGWHIELNLRRGKLYFAAGLKDSKDSANLRDSAFENLEAAREAALNERLDILYRVIMSEMRDMAERERVLKETTGS